LINIKIFYTGGTIGSEFQRGVTGLKSAVPNNLIERYHHNNPDAAVNFEIETLFNILSENITFEHWIKIYESLKEVDTATCNGIILTHGTDTLAYTAIFLSFLLQEVEVPILLVSSNYPLEDERANGYKNFELAVNFIGEIGVKGVFVSFAKNGEHRVYLGSRILPAGAFTHSFSSVGDVWFAEYTGRGFVLNSDPKNPTLAKLSAHIPFHIPEFREVCCVQYIAPHPTMDLRNITLYTGVKAVLYGLYHSGTACVDNGELFSFARKCNENGVDFYVAPFDSGMRLYSTSKKMLDMGVNFISDVSIEVAYMKLLIGYSAFEDVDERKCFIDKNVVFEKLICRGNFQG
jgi:L-asparaginase